MRRQPKKLPPKICNSTKADSWDIKQQVNESHILELLETIGGRQQHRSTGIFTSPQEI